ncbi:hypothetical protein CHELA20_10280 [Hyphomicrobiales bacterium]|nr:hypothetical protein CHELA20_10280 [Hyphomicrobiales bacterium]CAH1691399.1 hypothetical protein CHELA41_50507 [Hyphomicrobiales bacterium]
MASVEAGLTITSNARRHRRASSVIRETKTWDAVVERSVSVTFWRSVRLRSDRRPLPFNDGSLSLACRDVFPRCIR